MDDFERQELDKWLKDRNAKINAALAERRAIIAAGGMATKTAVEDVIMSKFGIDRYEAHGIMNEIEFKNLS